MNKIEARYGTVLRIYDNGGKTADRYTIIPPRWAVEYRESAAFWEAIGSSETPFHPQGFGMHISAAPGAHLGKRIRWEDLPRDVKTFARQSFGEFCPGPWVCGDGWVFFSLEEAKAHAELVFAWTGNVVSVEQRP